MDASATFPPNGIQNLIFRHILPRYVYQKNLLHLPPYLRFGAPYCCASVSRGCPSTSVLSPCPSLGVPRAYPRQVQSTWVVVCGFTTPVGSPFESRALVSSQGLRRSSGSTVPIRTAVTRGGAVNSTSQPTLV